MARGKAVAIDLTETERGELEALRRRHGTAQALALRARIVLLAADGRTNSAIAEGLGIAKHTVGKWRNRFAAARLDGLHDEPRPGAPRQIGDDAIAETIQIDALEPARHCRKSTFGQPGCGWARTTAWIWIASASMILASSSAWPSELDCR
jgi:DNA-binding CsgD family transcriptional regulator